MDDFRRRITAHSLVGLDTSIWIYHLEANARYLPLTTLILDAVRSGRPRAILSVVTVMELTVRPYRLNQPGVATHYEALLSKFPNSRILNVTPSIARQAAQLRAEYWLRPADALHVATSLVAGATAWITNDRDLRRLSSLIEVVVLDDLLRLGQ